MTPPRGFHSRVLQRGSVVSPTGPPRERRSFTPSGAGCPVTVSAEDQIAVIERWHDFGAVVRVLHLSDDAAIVQLCACTGEPVERLESRDPRVVAYLRASETGAT